MSKVTTSSRDAAAALAALPTTARTAAIQAMQYTVTWIETQAKQTTAFTDRTANLRNSIHGQVVKDAPTGVVGSVGAGLPGVGATMEYAARIELGFVGQDSLGRAYNQAPRPFIRPAVEEAVALKILSRAFKGLMERGASR
jgi:hypothetical protein